MSDSKKARTIKPSTEKKLFALSKNRCYHPNCSNQLITNDKKDVLAKIAHIEAASPNGPRFNENMTDDERRDFDNLILLCDKHHIEIDNHPKKFPTDILKEWKLLHEGTDGDALFQHTLKSKYLNDFKTISLLTTSTPKPIDEIFVNLAIIKEKKEEINQDKTINREALLSSYEEIYKPKEPIDIEELVSKSNKSLIYGKAGVGKTTLCKYIAYKWAKGELYREFEYLIYIPLREWKNDGIKGAILDYYYSLDEKNISIDFDAHKSLFLFDGYDELDDEKKKALRDEIDKYVLTHYLITTRPYGYQKSDFRVDEYFETIGFTDENVIEYIDNFFDQEKEKSEGLKSYLQNNISIRHIGYIPLMLEMICSLWEQKEFCSDMTMTELYGQVIENMLKKYSANKDDERVYKRQNRNKIQKQLGKLAFEGLTRQTIFFDGDFIEDSIDDIEFFEENVIYSGFLKSDVKEKDLLDNHFEFPHLTFQEYFAALYVSKLEPKEQSKIIRDWKFYPHMQMFFVFLGGLIDNEEFLLVEIESEPKDIIGLYILLLQIDCISQMTSTNLDTGSINKKLRTALPTLLQWGIHTESTLEKLKGAVSKLEHETILSLVEEVKFQEENDYELQKNIIDTLFSFYNYNSNNKKYLDILLNRDDEDVKRYISSLLNLENTNFKQYNFVNEIISDLKLLKLKNFEIRLILENIRNHRTYDKDIEKDIIQVFQKYNILNLPNWINDNIDVIYDEFTDYDIPDKTLYEEMKIFMTLEGIDEEYHEGYLEDSNYILKILNDKNSTMSLLKLLSDESVFVDVHQKVIYHLANVIDYTNEEINIILMTLENEKIDSFIAYSVMVGLLENCINKSFNKRIEELLYESIITNRFCFEDDLVFNNDLKEVEYQYFLQIDSLEESYIDKLIKLTIFSNNINVFPHHEANKKLTEIANNDFNTFNKLYIFSDYLLVNYLIEYLNSSVLFKAYDNNSNIIDYLSTSFMNSKKVFYIKNNKLHTIENGKEISTVKDIDRKMFPRIKS